MKLTERMPREDELEDYPPGARDVALLLRTHGINPRHVPATPDALTVDGWLRPTGAITPSGDDFELELIPWTIPAADVAEILAAFWNIDWTPQRPAPPPGPLNTRRDLARSGVQLGPPTVPRDAYLAAVRYWRQRLTAAHWAILAAGSAAFAIAWLLRPLLP